MTGRYRVNCSHCGELKADTDDGLFSEQAAFRRAGFHEGVQEDSKHLCSVETVEEDAVTKWKKHNSGFNYEPPERPADAWSEEQIQELLDHVINRRVKWLCKECTGHGPIQRLKDARRHVRQNHLSELLKRYETPQQEQDSVTDGGTPQTSTDRRKNENHGIGEFSDNDGH